MITVYGQIRYTVIYFTCPIDSFELENTVTGQTYTLSVSPSEIDNIGNLYYAYTMDFRDIDYGEYQYRAYLDDVPQETGLLKVYPYAEEDDPVQVTTYNDQDLNIVMYDGTGNE